jgi:signal transduction histidine kinase
VTRGTDGVPEEFYRAAGTLASGVADELARPMRELRDQLAALVEKLDTYVATAKGPTPYPWEATKALREEIADCYLLSRSLTRLAGDLADAIATPDPTVQPIDVGRQVEAAVALARHRIGASTEVFIDLGQLPPVRVPAGLFTVVVASLVLVAAESTRETADAAISIKTRRELGAETGTDDVVVSIADNGAGSPRLAGSIVPLARYLVTPLGGSFDGESRQGEGSAFDLRIPVSRR